MNASVDGRQRIVPARAARRWSGSWQQSARAGACAAALATMVSIAASHALLALSLPICLIAILRERAVLRWPPFAPALIAFFALTLLSAFAAESFGSSQIRKFAVYLFLPLLFTLVRTVPVARRLLLALAGVGVLSAMAGLIQFERMYRLAASRQEDFYRLYVGDRITGFMSHWMTFSGHMLIAMLLLAAWCCFGGHRRARWLSAAGAAICALALLLSFTRSMWLAAVVGLVYLLWCSHRRLILLIPVLIALLGAASPAPVQHRMASVYRPTEGLDSNRHRTVLRAVGIRIIAAQPLLGVGPGRVAQVFPRMHALMGLGIVPDTWYYAHLHNVYLHYAAERGLPAMLAFVAMLGWILRDLLRAVPRHAASGDGAFLLHAATSVLLALMAGGWYEYNFGDSEILAAFCVTVRCGYAAVEAVPRRDAAAAG